MSSGHPSPPPAVYSVPPGLCACADNEMLSQGDPALPTGPTGFQTASRTALVASTDPQNGVCVCIQSDFNEHDS